MNEFFLKIHDWAIIGVCWSVLGLLGVSIIYGIIGCIGKAWRGD